MPQSSVRLAACACVALAGTWCLAVAPAAQSPGSQRLRLDTLTLPAGFSISVYADSVPNARSLALGPGGSVFVGTRTAGNVYALVDANKDQKADEVLTLARGYEPFVEGWLQNRKPWGRPVDVLTMPDGALLVSDDFAGAVYRIAYSR